MMRAPKRPRVPLFITTFTPLLPSRPLRHQIPTRCPLLPHQTTARPRPRQPTALQSPAQTDPRNAADEPRPPPPKRVVSVETRRKIAFSMLGQKKSEDMKQKVSQKLKGRVPWNKGKKLSPETRARMSEAHAGRPSWNKGKNLSRKHRSSISKSCSSRTVTEDTRFRMRLARRRPGDAIVSGSLHHATHGTYPLVDSADINDYVTLRRQLRIWSDTFVARNGRRPSLADIRRVAPPSVMRRFERYVLMRDSIRGLASDVYGGIDPKAMPVVPAGESSSVPRNNSQTYIRVTKHGNNRLVSSEEAADGKYVHPEGLQGSKEDMWDEYDRPQSLATSDGAKPHTFSLIGTHEMQNRPGGQLSANDYRMIGKYRLLESFDIHRYVKLKKELENWSNEFKRIHGRTPALSDANTEGKSMLYNRFCEFVDMRDRMNGLAKEVYGTEIDDLKTFEKIDAEGKIILDTLRSGTAVPKPRQEKDDCEDQPASK